MESILRQFPPAWVNNSREIVKEKLLRFKKYPSERLTQELEQLGITVDFTDDWGNGPRGEEDH